MRKKTKFRAVYSELTDAIGERASTQFIAESAAALVDLYDQEANEPRFDLQDEDKNIDQWTTDTVIEADGWGLYKEMEWELGLRSEDDLSLQARYDVLSYTGKDLCH